MMIEEDFKRDFNKSYDFLQSGMGLHSRLFKPNHIQYWITTSATIKVYKEGILKFRIYIFDGAKVREFQPSIHEDDQLMYLLNILENQPNGIHQIEVLLNYDNRRDKTEG